MHTQKVPLFDANGEPEFLLGISEDISERKKMEETEHLLSTIVQSSDDAISART